MQYNNIHYSQYTKTLHSLHVEDVNYISNSWLDGVSQCTLHTAHCTLHTVHACMHACWILLHWSPGMIWVPLHYTAEYSVVRHSSLCAGYVTSTVRGGVTFKKNQNNLGQRGGGSDPNPSFCSEFPFFRSHKLSFPILQNMCNSENLT